MRRRVRLIANPVAGKNAPEKIRQAESFLRRRGCEVELFLTSARGDARRAAAEARHQPWDLILVAGGDGTLNEVVNGLAPSNIPLAFLPLGTANVFALEVGLSFDIEQACRIALEGKMRPVCLGLAGETRFLLMAGIGFDAEVVYGINPRLKSRIGKLAYIAGGMQALLLRQSSPMEVIEEDGTAHRCFGAIIGNCRYYGGRFSLTPRASLIDDRLEVCLLLRPGRLHFLHFAAAVAAGRPPGPPDAECLQGKNFEVRGEGLPIQIDGDFLGRSPMNFRAVFGELTFVLPEDFNSSAPMEGKMR